VRLPSSTAGSPIQSNPQWFATTHWSVVLAAKGEAATDAKAALGELCSVYWRPIYSYIRREGYRQSDAEDLTQGFFGQLLEKNYLQHLVHQRGKFRSFLLTFLKHFLSDERDRGNAQKRGGGQKVISLDELPSEEREGVEPSSRLTPEQQFDRRWAETLLAHAVKRLRAEYEAKGKGLLFNLLSGFEPGKHGAQSYLEIGAQLGMSESGIKSAVHRLRTRHREILREEIAQTVSSPEEIEQEIRYLLEIVCT
jgi:DNA-directed RNA polymerase specialized sigma24 family protein